MLTQPHFHFARKEAVKAFKEYMEILGEQSQVEELTRVYEVMKKSGVVLPLGSYNQLLADFGKLGEVAMAEQIYTDMLQREIKPSEKTYHILINICRLDPLSVILSRSKDEERFKKAPPNSDIRSVLDYLRT